MPAVAPAPVEVPSPPGRPGSPPSYREMATLASLHDSKLHSQPRSPDKTTPIRIATLGDSDSAPAGVIEAGAYTRPLFSST
jgi:hypothetical protein